MYGIFDSVALLDGILFPLFKLLELKTAEEKKVGLAFLKAILEDTKG